MLSASYFLGLTRIGTAVLVEQDFADIFLPLAKMLHYGSIEPLSTIVFAAFAVAWIPTRHGLYFYIFSAVVNVDPETASNGVLTRNHQIGFVVALTVFQGLLLMWLKELIIGIKNVLTAPSYDAIVDHREVKSKKNSKKDS